MTQSPPGQAARPLSPHLQVWRWHITMFCSIAHRATGVVLSGGAVALVFWLLALANGPDAFEMAQAIAGSWLGYLALFVWSFSLFYHLANGIRHLVWDSGHGFAPKTATQSAWIVIAFALAATLVLWAMIARTGAL